MGTSKHGRPARQRIDRPGQPAAAPPSPKVPAEPGIRPVGLEAETARHRDSRRGPQLCDAAAAAGTGHIRKADEMGAPDGRQEATAPSGAPAYHTATGRNMAGTTGARPPSRGTRRAEAAERGRKSSRGRAAQSRAAPGQAGKAGQMKGRTGESSGTAGLSGWQRRAPTPAHPGPKRSRWQRTAAGTRCVGGRAGAVLPAASPAAPGPAMAAPRKARAGTGRPGLRLSGRKRRPRAAVRARRGRGAGAGPNPAKVRSAQRRRARWRTNAQRGREEGGSGRRRSPGRARSPPHEKKCRAAAEAPPGPASS